MRRAGSVGHAAAVQMDVDGAAAAAADAVSACASAEHGLPPNALVEEVRAEARWLADTAAVVRGLRCPHMRDRHWFRLQGLVPALPATGPLALPVDDICSCGLVDEKDRCVCLLHLAAVLVDNLQ